MQYRFIQENEIFIWSFISIFCSRRSVMIILNLSAAMSCKTEHGVFAKFKKPVKKTAVVLIAGVTISGTYSVPPSLHCTIWCRSTFGPRGQGLSNSTSFLRPALPILRPVQCYDNFKLKTSKTAVVLIAGVTVSPSRVLHAPGTSLYRLVPKHLRATWTRPEQSHLLPEACSPTGTDNRRQRKRQMKHPPLKPSDILKRCYALYDNKLRYYMKKVSKLYYLLNPILHTVIN